MYDFCFYKHIFTFMYFCNYACFLKMYIFIYLNFVLFYFHIYFCGRSLRQITSM